MTIHHDNPDDIDVDVVPEVHNNKHGHHPHEKDHHDDHEGHHEEEEELHWYRRPRQRQKWGDTQVLPHTNWGDTFFDLFYVAAAYNLGNVIRLEPSWTGVLYFCGCFYPVMIIWGMKMYYDSRFAVGSIFHRAYETGLLLALGTAVVHIRPVKYLSAPSKYNDMFVFSISIFFATLFGVGRMIEVFLAVEGGEASAKNAAKHDMFFYSIMTIFYMAAAIVSGSEYYNNNNSDSDYYRMLAEAYKDNETTDYGYEGDYGYDSPKTYVNHTPIALMFAGYSIYYLQFLRRFFQSNEERKSTSVPMNVTFFIHRDGAWIMLMLGESVLSLLIVQAQSGNFYKAFFSGVFSIILLELLHFRSQPHDASGHAYRRSIGGSFAFTILNSIYSAALIVLGTSYKMIQYEYVYEVEYSSAYRMLAAASGPPIADTKERQQRIAHFYCFSLALVWFCLDNMTLAHRGIQHNIDRCTKSNKPHLHFLGISMFWTRLGLIVLFGTFGFYITEPMLLSFVGLIGIMVQIGLRILGSYFFFQSDNE